MRPARTSRLPPPATAAEFHAYGAVAKLFDSDEGEVVISGPAGTGKSLGCLHYLHFLATEYPGFRGLIARKTRESLTQSGLVTYESKVLTPGEHRRIAANCMRRVRQSYEYPNGSELVVGGLDKPTKIMSTEFDACYVQEAIELTETDWESITTRLRNGIAPRQQLFADTNPDAPHHWLKRRADRGDCLMLESRHEDNPSLWDRKSRSWTPAGVTYIKKLDKLTGSRKPRLRYGKWVQSEGAVYERWDRATHLVDRFEIPAEWRRFRVVDFGFTNAFVCQWWALDPDGRMFLYREIYRTGRTVRAHAVRIKELSGGEGCEATVADHDAEDRATLLEGGIRTRPAYKPVKRGISAVEERLGPAGDGRPRLFVLRDSRVDGADHGMEEAKKPTSTVEEFDGYVWAKAADGRPAKEEPEKLNDHGMDCVRYAACYADRIGRKTYEAS